MRHPSMRLASSALTLLTLCSISAAQSTPVQLVNTQIGTTDLGHAFAGASLPYGMAKAVADTTSNNRGGFSLDGQKVSGFSHMHDTGTGGGSSMGNFPIFPYAGCAGDTPDGCAPFIKNQRAVPFDTSSVIGSPGYWSVQLNTGIQGEMTVTKHTALYRFTFPNEATGNATLAPFFIVDHTDLYDSRSSGTIKIDPNTGRMTGGGRFTPGFGDGSYQSFFCADFVGAPLTGAGTWRGAKTSQTMMITFGDQSQQGGTYARFSRPKGKMFVRVGVSLVSAAQACQNAEKEIPKFGSAFRSVRDAATKAWSDKLGVVKINSGGASVDLQRTFWSGIYRGMISPQDYTDENPLWSSSEPYFDSYYCIWDSFRAQHPLLTVVDPVEQTRMVRSLIDIYRHLGYLPDCRMQLSKGYTQGGSNAEIMLTDSYLKGINDGVDWPTAFQGMIQDAEVQSDEWLVQGRGHLANYKKLGYIPKDDNGGGYGLEGSTISRTVEYAYDDFCIAEMAKKMGNTDALVKYRGRASNWKNLFNANTTSMGYTGFLQPRLINGKFVSQNPTRGSPANSENCCGSFSADIETYEGSCWSYTFFAPGDMAALVTKLGGGPKFVQRLDYMHENNLLDIGNEQGFFNVFQYHYAGRPGRSSYRAHYYIPSRFNDTVILPGNDDSGAMGTFTSWSMMGLFPNPGQNVYLITAPFFKIVQIKSPVTGNVATITNTNFDPSYNSIYIQSAKLNGQTYTKNWLNHSFFLDGGTLELTLGPTESATWGKGKKNIPPSLSTDGLVVA